MGDWVSILDAAYRLDHDDATWLSAILAAATPLMLTRPERSYAFTYQATAAGELRFETIATQNLPPGTGRAEIEYSHAGLASDDVQRSFGRTPCGTASQVIGEQFREKLRMAAFEAFDIRDTFGVNALDPTGRGSALVGLLSQQTRADAATLRTWTQIAAHIAAARRLRTALAGPLGSDPARQERVEAIVAADGKLEHAAAPEVHAARGKLVEAVGAIQRAHGRERRERPDEVLAGWSAMVEARWSLVEQFESDGKRYIVAVRNEAEYPSAASSFPTLTLRERQVVGFTLLGHSSKVVAYELGISSSTVRVLLSRAFKKLGVRTTRDLVRLGAPPAR